MTAEIRERQNKLGQCTCPICKSPEAEVLQGARLPYIVCEDCGTLIQTRRRNGARLIAAMMTPDHPVKDPEPKPLQATASKSSSTEKPALKKSGIDFLLGA